MCIRDRSIEEFLAKAADNTDIKFCLADPSTGEWSDMGAVSYTHLQEQVDVSFLTVFLGHRTIERILCGHGKSKTMNKIFTFLLEIGRAHV